MQLGKAAPVPEATTLERRHEQELEHGDRFPFGENWRRFLRVLDEERIVAAEESLLRMLGVDSLGGRSFLDVGCGSGLLSLAARRLGARVHSLDYDPASVACTRELRRRYFDGDSCWTVEAGSVLDADYMASLGRFDIVYAWGVLHHTGQLWRACENVILPLARDGLLFVSIYNDQGAWSERWRRVKRLYVSGPVGRALVRSAFIPGTYVRNLAADLVWMRNPLRRYADYKQRRGMSVHHDLIDWLGGYPFEVAKPEEVFEFFAARGLQLRKLRTQGGTMGCNEFVFEYTPARARAGTQERSAQESAGAGGGAEGAGNVRQGDAEARMPVRLRAHGVLG